MLGQLRWLTPPLLQHGKRPFVILQPLVTAGLAWSPTTPSATFVGAQTVGIGVLRVTPPTR
jgi:hypothetical protein